MVSAVLKAVFIMQTLTHTVHSECMTAGDSLGCYSDALQIDLNEAAYDELNSCNICFENNKTVFNRDGYNLLVQLSIDTARSNMTKCDTCLRLTQTGLDQNAIDTIFADVFYMIMIFVMGRCDYNELYGVAAKTLVTNKGAAIQIPNNSGVHTCADQVNELLHDGCSDAIDNFSTGCAKDCASDFMNSLRTVCRNMERANETTIPAVNADASPADNSNAADASAGSESAGVSTDGWIGISVAAAVLAAVCLACTTKDPKSTQSSASGTSAIIRQ